jgi:hypothetical protein
MTPLIAAMFAFMLIGGLTPSGVVRNVLVFTVLIVLVAVLWLRN